jgi:hypothetical protein
VFLTVTSPRRPAEPGSHSDTEGPGTTLSLALTGTRLHGVRFWKIAVRQIASRAITVFQNCAQNQVPNSKGRAVMSSLGRIQVTARRVSSLPGPPESQTNYRPRESQANYRPSRRPIAARAPGPALWSASGVAAAAGYKVS